MYLGEIGAALVGTVAGVLFCLAFALVLRRHRRPEAAGKLWDAPQWTAEELRRAAEWEDALRRVQSYSPEDAYGLTDSAEAFRPSV